MEIPSHVNIIKITAATSSNPNGHGSATIYGLGDDQNMYFWRSDIKTWILFES